MRNPAGSGISLLFLFPALLVAAPISIVNPSGEINGGVEGTDISDPSVLGWDAVDGQINAGDIDFGNGAWRLTYEDGGELFQMTSHAIEAGASYSLRFDASNFAGPNGSGFDDDLTLVEGATKNGDFNADTSPDLSRNFSQTPEWFNLGTSGQTIEATKTDKSVDGTRSAVVSQGATKIFGLDTGHTLATGEVFQATYQWLDASNWNDPTDRVRVSLFTTDDELITGVRSDIEALTSDLSTSNGVYQDQESLFTAIPGAANGKRLFVAIDTETNNDGSGFTRVDNFTLKRGNVAVSGPASMAVDFYVDNGGARQVVATYAVAFKAQTIGDWQHYHVAVPEGTLDAEAGMTLGIQFRGAALGATTYQSIDNVRLDAWPAAAGVPVTIVNPSGEVNDGVDRHGINSQFNPATTGWDAITSGTNQYINDQASEGAWRLTISDNGELFQMTGQVIQPGDAYSFEFDASTFGNLPSHFRPFLYIENGGRVRVRDDIIRFRNTTAVNTWNRYRLTAQAGTLDEWAGSTIGVGVAGVDETDTRHLSIDNVALTRRPAGASVPGDFVDSWQTTPDQVWTGPGTWANRLLDWQVASGQINCVGDSGSRDRRTMHRTGTSVRGSGEDFHLTVRTGLHGGTWTNGARTGFLVGAGPNLDWRGAFLVHDAWGRDFGLFCGMRGDGTAAIEDYSNASNIEIGNIGTVPAVLPAPARIELDAVYNAPSYDLTVSVYEGDSEVLASQATATVSSGRVLGSFGLLSHRGNSTAKARHWFDDFGGSGGALQHEADRQLTIMGAMHTLSRGSMRMCAQFPPFDLTTTPTAYLDTWDGGAWQEIGSAPIDTAVRSAYNAIFTVGGWDDTVDTPYRVRLPLGDNEGGAQTWLWEGTVRKDPVDKDEIVVCGLTGQRIASGNVQNEPRDWTPVHMWHPHVKPIDYIAKHQPDLIGGTGDQIYEGQPTPADNSSDFDRHYDYLGKWYIWLLQWRDLARDIPTMVLPDDHDVYQGNLWGEGGAVAPSQNEGGYVRPADWVKMVERTQTANLPDPDPYNPVQPAPPVLQGIGVYFTGISYGRVGIAVIEDRKFKTGGQNPPPEEDRVLLGQRQHDFLEAFAKDWVGQDVKFVFSQSPLANLHTHASAGYGFGINDKDAHGWPTDRRNEAWRIIRKSFMFQYAGDQHLATVARHGADAPRDAGYSFAVPALSNFFPRVWDPVHNSGGTTSVVSPHKGDFYFDGNGLLPDGITPNLMSDQPHHFAMLAVGNPKEYYRQTRGIDPPALHDRGAGYGIVRIKKSTREITFECWPRFADPEFPQTGGQYPDWPMTISQFDNEGRTPAGYLPVVGAGSDNPVVCVTDEATGETVYAVRIRGGRFHPPVYDAGTTYQIDITEGDATSPTTSLTGQTVDTGTAHAIDAFDAVERNIVLGDSARLVWQVRGSETLSIDEGVGDVTLLDALGSGYVEVSPTVDTTYTLTSDDGGGGILQSSVTVRVFPDRATWRGLHFTPPELGDEGIEATLWGDDADPDGDGIANWLEHLLGGDPRVASPEILPNSEMLDQPDGKRYAVHEFTELIATGEAGYVIEAGIDLVGWDRVVAPNVEEVGRVAGAPVVPDRVTARQLPPIDDDVRPRRFYRMRIEDLR